MNLDYITCTELDEYFTFMEAPLDTAFFLKFNKKDQLSIFKVVGPDYDFPVPASSEEILAIIEHSPDDLMRFVSREAYDFMQLLSGIGIKWVARDYDKTVRGFDVKPTRSGRPDNYWYGGHCHASVMLLFTPLGEIVTWAKEPVRTDMFVPFPPLMKSNRREST